ncbi:MAG: restriction endonuclease subunit S [Crocinitomicaceae bacterium]|nr:restriction endonuclease subunit S [Crocinitomicaceae bacterium]
MMKHPKPYPAYKNSGIAWIGEVPEHWEVIKLFGGCNFIRGNSSFKKDELLSNGKYIALQYGKTYKINEVDSRYKFYVNDEFYKASQIVKQGDVIIISTSETIEDLGHSVFYNRSDLGLLGGEQVLLRSKNSKFSEKYLYYSTKTFTNELKMHATGVKVFRFNITDLKSIYTFVPPLSEQTAIARFLDYKLGKINRFIRKKKQLIKLLNEQKAAIINQAVTKGLNPNAPMKDSGVEWLGEVPEGWEVRRIKFLITGRLKYGANEPGGNFIPNAPRYIRITDFDSSGNLRDDTFCSLDLTLANPYLLKEGDILFARSGGTVGKTFQFKNYKGLACYAGYLIKAEPNIEKITSDYLFVFTNSGVYNQWKNFIFNKATIENIGADKYSNLPVILPPLHEQQEIVSYIESETSTITATIANIEKEIGLVEEYKTALIAEAVTGKIDVRGYEVPEMESEEEGYEEMEEEMNMAAEDDAADFQTEDAV